MPLLKAITSASEDEIHQLTRFWIYDCTSVVDEEISPFLFINQGVATLSGSMVSAAIVRDTVTHREIQVLKHTGTCCLQSSAAFSKAHVSSHQSSHLGNGTFQPCLETKCAHN